MRTSVIYQAGLAVPEHDVRATPDALNIILSTAAAPQKRRHPTDPDAGTIAVLRMALLSPREREVLVALVEGDSNKVIAYALGISARTVEVHRAHMMTKLGVRSFAEAVRIAVNAETGKHVP